MSKAQIMTFSAIAIAVFGVTALVGYLGLNQVVAQVTGNSFPKIIENLSAKFNLNPSDVQTVFEETRDQAHAARLDEAVKAGDITSEQKNLILEKQKEIRTKVEEINNKQLTTTERLKEMQTVRDEMSDWATKNNIPLRYIGIGGMMGRGGFGKGVGMHMGQGMMDFDF